MIVISEIFLFSVMTRGEVYLSHPGFEVPYEETGSDESSSLFVSDNLHSQDWRGGGGDGRDERLEGKKIK